MHLLICPGGTWLHVDSRAVRSRLAADTTTLSWAAFDSIMDGAVDMEFQHFVEWNLSLIEKSHRGGVSQPTSSQPHWQGVDEIEYEQESSDGEPIRRKSIFTFLSSSSPSASPPAMGFFKKGVWSRIWKLWS